MAAASGARRAGEFMRAVSYRNWPSFLVFAQSHRCSMHGAWKNHRTGRWICALPNGVQGEQGKGRAGPREKCAFRRLLSLLPRPLSPLFRVDVCAGRT
jgi:hypothetical protein